MRPVATVVLLLSLLLVACGGSTVAPPAATEVVAEPATPTAETPPTATTSTSLFDPIKTACLVTDIGSVEDGTYNESAYQGLLRAAEEFNLEHELIETRSSDEYKANIEKCLEGGFKVVITVGPFYAEQTLAAAQAHPDAHFIATDQSFEEIPENLVTIHFREDQAGFLAGALACMMTEENKVAGVYGIEIPPLKRFRNGFENGCHYVNPDAETLGTYMESFIDPQAGAEAADGFIAEGADVIFGAAGATGGGALRQGAQAGVYVIGVDQDEYKTTFLDGQAPGSEMILSSAVKEVGQGVYDQLRGLAEPESDLWAGGEIYLMEVANDGIGYAEFHEAEAVIPEAVQERLAEIRELLASGELQTGVDVASGDPDPDTMPEAVPFESEE
ncbi:MAG: BMP family ABC transporter substrate-binding protein [Ardenticatenales bacterium]|nr:BMP family ABC transporter substrate-binding protein [Ardenticatenales bacterium]